MASFGDVDRNVTITFVGRDNASRAMSSIGSSASRTSKIVGGLVKVLKYAAVAAAAALAASAVLVAKGLWDATKAAYEDTLANNKLSYAMMKAQHATSEQIETTIKWIDKMELATRFADDEMRPALTALALTGMSVKKSQELLTIAMDVAEAKGKSLQSVSEALAKGYNGQLTGLQRLGVKVTDSKDKALSFAEVLKTLKQRTEGAAYAAARSDPWTVLGHAFQQLKEKIGEKLLPVVYKLSDWMIHTAVPWIKRQLVPAVKDFSTWIQKEAIPWIQKLNDRFSAKGGLYDTLGETWGKIVDVAEALGRLVGAITGKGDGAKGKGANDSTKTIADSMTSMAESVGSVADSIQSLIDKIAVLEEKWHFIKGLTPDVNLGESVDPRTWFDWATDAPEWFPGDAAGGWLKRRAGGGWAGRWTMVGEHGPELINNRGFVRPHSASMGAGRGGGNTFIIQGAVDPVSTARQIERILAKGRRVTGASGLSIA